MGDIIELLETIYRGLYVSEQSKNSNLYAYLLNEELITERYDQEGSLQATITVKGEYYLNTLYLLRLDQTPKNFLEKESSKIIVRQLQRDGYIRIFESESSELKYRITDSGKTLLNRLKE